MAFSKPLAHFLIDWKVDPFSLSAKAALKCVFVPTGDNPVSIAAVDKACKAKINVLAGMEIDEKISVRWTTNAYNNTTSFVFFNGFLAILLFPIGTTKFEWSDEVLGGTFKMCLCPDTRGQASDGFGGPGRGRGGGRGGPGRGGGRGGPGRGRGASADSASAEVNVEEDPEKDPF